MEPVKDWLQKVITLCVNFITSPTFTLLDAIVFGSLRALMELGAITGAENVFIFAIWCVISSMFFTRKHYYDDPKS